jgi:hypothetical protein
MNKMKKKLITFRPPAITEDQLEDLVEYWGENKSQVIIRCIDRIWCSVIDCGDFVPQQSQSERETDL